MWKKTVTAAIAIACLAVAPAAAAARATERAISSDVVSPSGQGCGSVVTKAVRLEDDATDVRPVGLTAQVGDVLSLPTGEEVATVTAIDVVRDGRRTKVRWTMRGTGAPCENPGALSPGWRARPTFFGAVYRIPARRYFAGYFVFPAIKPVAIVFAKRMPPVIEMRWRRWGGSVAVGVGWWSLGLSTDYRQRVRMRLSESVRCNGFRTYMKAELTFVQQTRKPLVERYACTESAGARPS